MTTRKISQLVTGQPTTDGAGVELVRVIGQPALMDLDPFLLLDTFRSDNPDDYIAGFPPHPHRGFETVTYLLNGRMRHKDNAGNEGVIEPGGIQWMTAGKGIVHSEMPEQEDGLLEGFPAVDQPAGQPQDDHPGLPGTRRDPDPDRDSRRHPKSASSPEQTSKGTVGPVTPAADRPPLPRRHPATRRPLQRTRRCRTRAPSFMSFAARLELEGHRWQTTPSVGRDQLAVLDDGDEVDFKAVTRKPASC